MNYDQAVEFAVKHFDATPCNESRGWYGTKPGCKRGKVKAPVKEPQQKTEAAVPPIPKKTTKKKAESSSKKLVENKSKPSKAKPVTNDDNEVQLEKNRASYRDEIGKLSKAGFESFAKSSVGAKAPPPQNIEEAAALVLYSRKNYKLMNAKLRGSLSDEQKAEYEKYKGLIDNGIALATNGLKEMPSHKGEVLRGAYLPDDVISQYKPGSIITEKGFTSTTTSKAAADVFTGNVRYIINSKNGKNVSRLSQFPEEEEIVFPPSTKFKVSKVEPITKKLGNGGTETIHHIYMEEA